MLRSARLARQKSANRVLTHRSKKDRYSITSSARASSVAGTSRPIACAVLRLITNSYFAGACTHVPHHRRECGIVDPIADVEWRIRGGGLVRMDHSVARHDHGWSVWI
jgi:hypothetical protein